MLAECCSYCKLTYEYWNPAKRNNIIPDSDGGVGRAENLVTNDVIFMLSENVFAISKKK